MNVSGMVHPLLKGYRVGKEMPGKALLGSGSSQDQVEGRGWSPMFSTHESSTMSRSQHPSREEKGSWLWLPGCSRLLEEAFVGCTNPGPSV